MARQRMITRTIKAYTAHCMTVDTETATVGTANLTFTGTKPANIEKALVQHSTTARRIWELHPSPGSLECGWSSNLSYRLSIGSNMSFRSSYARIGDSTGTPFSKQYSITAFTNCFVKLNP